MALIKTKEKTLLHSFEEVFKRCYLMPTTSLPCQVMNFTHVIKLQLNLIACTLKSLNVPLASVCE
jgi:hypothetical protein